MSFKSQNLNFIKKLKSVTCKVISDKDNKSSSYYIVYNIYETHSMAKKIIKYLLLVIFVLLVIILFNTFTYHSRQVNVTLAQPVKIDTLSIQHLSDAIKFKTISYDDPAKFDSIPIAGFINYLKNTYPLVDSVLKKTVVNKYNLLYKWQGKNKEQKPMLLMAHMDVVPVGEGADTTWKVNPFSGAITKEEDGPGVDPHSRGIPQVVQSAASPHNSDEFIWGRGTMDDKVSVIGIMEAVNILLKEGFVPERTIYLAFGHDEEIGGRNGAKKIAEYLESEKVVVEYVLDEGLLLTENVVPGISKPVALIGIAEKGYISAQLSVAVSGGHSSMPPKETPVGILSAAISKLEKSPFKAHFSPPVEQFLSYVGPEMPFGQKIAFANKWLFKKIIISKYEASASGNASVRTTTAPTIFNAGIKDNILPAEAKAIINFRILPGETTAFVLEHIKNTIADDRIKIEKYGSSNEPSTVSSTEANGFKVIEKTIKQVFPNTITAPSLVIASTDSKHYAKIADNVYRFLPIRANSEDLSRIHGVNERISVTNYKECINFYYRLIVNSSNQITN
jgi:carboxypeptidase PM20D1